MAVAGIWEVFVQAALDFDICANKHGGNRNSEAANRIAEPHKATLRQTVYLYVKACGRYGATSKEIAAELGKPLHAISGRISELKKECMLVDTGEDRDGASVLHATE